MSEAVLDTVPVSADQTRDLTAKIVSAHVANNNVAVADLAVSERKRLKKVKQTAQAALMRIMSSRVVCEIYTGHDINILKMR